MLIKHVILFFDLDDLITDLLDDREERRINRQVFGDRKPLSPEVVRLEVMDFTVSIFKDIGIRNAAIGVHVRTITPLEGTLLVWFMPVDVIQTMGQGRPRDEQTAARYDVAWDKARTLGQRVRQHLEANGFSVRPGLIDIDETKLVLGEWKQDPIHRPPPSPI